MCGDVYRLIDLWTVLCAVDIFLAAHGSYDDSDIFDLKYCSVISRVCFLLVDLLVLRN